MGKASSSKKVARAAGTGGGRTNRTHTPWTYVAALAVIVVLGVAATVASRSHYESQLNGTTSKNATVAPTIGGTPWNEGYAVDICGHFLAPIKAPTSKTGITTDGNGVIHIAPTVKSAAGKNATLGVFATSVGLTLSADQVQVPRGKTYTNGNDCAGKPAKVYVKQYAYAGDPKGSLVTQDPTSVRLADNALVTIAFVPSSEKASIPAPPASVQDALKAAEAAAVPTTTTTTTTTPATSTTTVAGKSSTTTTSGGTASSTTTPSTTAPSSTAPSSTATTSKS